MLVELAMRALLPVLIGLGAAAVLLTLRAAGWIAGSIVNTVIRVVFAILTGVVVGSIWLVRLIALGVRAIVWRLRG